MTEFDILVCFGGENKGKGDAGLAVSSEGLGNKDGGCLAAALSEVRLGTEALKPEPEKPSKVGFEPPVLNMLGADCPVVEKTGFDADAGTEVLKGEVEDG